MASLGSLTLDLVARTGNFVAGLTKAERESKAFERKVKRNAKRVGAAMTAMSAAAVAATFAMSRSYQQAIEETSNAAKQIDTSYQSYVNLDQVAKDTGASMSQVESAARRLNREIGKAESGNQNAVSTFSDIGVTLEQLAGLQADEKIALINDALDKNVPATERAAKAAEIFGTRNAQAIKEINSDALDKATAKVDKFGLALSDTEILGVEKANEAIADIGLIVDTVGTKLAVELAPAFQVVAEMIMGTSDEAGDFGEVITKSIRYGIEVVAELINIFDGAKVAASLAVNGIMLIFVKFAQGFTNNIYRPIADRIENLASLASMVGIDIDVSRMTGALDAVDNALSEMEKNAEAKIQQRLDTPLAGDKLLADMERIRKETEREAEANKSAKDSIDQTNRSRSEAARMASEAAKQAEAHRKELSKLIDSLEEEAATLGLSERQQTLRTAKLKGATAAEIAHIEALQSTVRAHRDAEKAAEDYKNLVAELRSEEEARLDTLQKQLDIIERSGASQVEQAEMARRAAEQAATTDMPEFGGGDTTVGKLKGLDGDEQELQEWYDRRLEMLASFREEHAEQSELWDEQEIEAHEHYKEQMNAIDRARQEVMLESMEAMFGAGADLSRQFLGEQNDLYKALFALEKGAAIARSMIAIQQGIAMAAANPFPMNLAAMASVASATAGLVGSITAIGMAHDGIDSVPESGTWLLEKGERVMTSETSAKLDNTLDGIDKEKRGRGDRDGGHSGVTINLYEDAEKAGSSSSSETDEGKVIDIFVSNIRSDGEIADALQGKYGLETVGR